VTLSPGTRLGHHEEQRMSISEIETTDTTRDGSCLRLRFEDRTAIASLQELPLAIERWNSILSAFSLVNRGTPPGARLLDIRGHAPLVIDLAVHANLLAPLQMGVSGCLKSFDELTALAEKIGELRQLNVRDEILMALEEQVRDNRHATTARTAEEIKTHYECDDDARNDVHKALMTLAQFMEDGGHIEFANVIMPSDADARKPLPKTLPRKSDMPTN
jgi:hypothetical protein